MSIQRILLVLDLLQQDLAKGLAREYFKKEVDQKFGSRCHL